MDAPKSVIKRIRQEIEDSRRVRLWQDSINMLDTVSESVFSRSAHFILEILQNAEDAGSKLPGKGEISFYVSPSRIKVTHNGASFSDVNVDAICGVRSSKKPEEGTLGYLGIGFKSVFKISDCPQVHSGGYHFEFNKNAYADPIKEPWQIIPIWVENTQEPLDSSITTFLMPFRNIEAYEQTLQELQKLDVHIFLFLKWLKKLTIVDEKSGDIVVIENLGEKNKVATLKKEDKKGTKTHRFVIFRRSQKVPQDVSKDSSLEFYKRQAVKEREIVLAFSVDNSDNLQPIEDASALGSVSSFLPLVEERTGARFLIQSDFLVQPGREAIQYELSWNHWLIEKAALLAEEAIEEFKKHPKWKNQFLPVFKFQSYSAHMSFSKLFYPKLQQPLLDYLKSHEVYPTESGQHVNPSQAVQLEEKAKGLVEDNDLSVLFPNSTGMRLAATDLDIKAIPDEVQLQVKKLDLGKIARDYNFLEMKAKQTGYVQWFVKLYKAMAETHQTYKEIQGQDSRGRIKWYPSPIYMLSEKDGVILASNCYLRQISNEVLKLRATFPEVDSLLSSYPLIHLGLDLPELEEFFKEHTHVQSIDYSKICRDVFLPKVRVNVPALAKDKLFAYTRLLQKGPEIRDIIWVITSNGKMKPSNQVFLGMSYSPSENWETLSKYVPNIDFLSSEYLQGVLSQDIPAWKEFFIRLGSNESGENHDVETFATEFVKANLASELSNFIAKDRQQHGYDLEAILTKSGALVKLEVKGRKKKEEPIDLIGKEPEAARQAKLNGEAFWVCIVPNVPENPELWVVEDALKVGQTNILTIPISAWKQNGRRVI
jgi:hypothetical protein